MRKFVIAGVLACALALPSIASANTGSVLCDSRGVVFTYNANFHRATWVTENVGGAQRILQVNQYAVTVDVWAGVQSTVVASASWQGGSIGPVTLHCPAPPAPPAPPAVTAPPAVAVPPATVTPAPPAATTSPPSVTPVVALKCPKGTKLYKNYGHTIICLKKKIVRKTKIKFVPSDQVKPPKKRTSRGGAGGVTG